MTPAARLQAAIEILDEVIASARDDGPPADTIVTRYFKQRRYAGSKDRRAVRELVFRAIRRSAERPRAAARAMLGLARTSRTLLELFGEPRGPEPSQDGEARRRLGCVPELAEAELSPLVAQDEWPALLERAPLDLRVNVARAHRATRCWRNSRARADAAQPVGHPSAARQPGRRSSGLCERARRGPGRGQPADRARLRADERPADARSLRRRGRQGARARRRGARRDDPRDRQQSCPAVEARAARRTSRRTRSKPGS